MKKKELQISGPYIDEAISESEIITPDDNLEQIVKMSGRKKKPSLIPVSEASRNNSVIKFQTTGQKLMIMQKDNSSLNSSPIIDQSPMSSFHTNKEISGFKPRLNMAGVKMKKVAESLVSSTVNSSITKKKKKLMTVK